MVNLGLVRDFKDCPLETAWLSFTMPPGYGSEKSLLRSWIRNGVRSWELVVPRRTGEGVQDWVSRMARVVSNLGGYAWCVNTHELVQKLQLPVDKALQEWGGFFWLDFRKDSLFYFKTGQDADLIRPILEKWQRNETIICFRDRYDLTRERLPMVISEPDRLSVSRFLKFFRPPFNLPGQGKS